MNDTAAFRLAREKLGKCGVAIRDKSPLGNKIFKVGVAVNAVTVEYKGISCKSWEDAFERAGIKVPRHVYSRSYQLLPR